MTTHTRRPLICECGQQGYLELSENDQPFSGLWEQYGLEGFSGSSLTITSYADMPKDVLAALNPTCPRCGQVGKVKYAKGI
jgi:hypothetical protein